jgi:hypothetical protein
MKKELLWVAILMCVLPAMAAKPLFDGVAAEAELSLFDGNVDIIQEDGKWVWSAAKPGIVRSRAVIPINLSKKYRVSGKFRASEAKGAVHFGLILYDAKKQMIAHPHVKWVAGTDTTLTEDVSIGTKTLAIGDGSNWQKNFTNHVYVAFNAKEGYEDLPNRELSPYINKVEQVNGKWLVQLRSPMGRAYPAETKIRQHREGAYFCQYLPLTNKWQFVCNEIDGESKDGQSGTQFWPAARYAQVVMILAGNVSPVQFDNIRLEEYVPGQIASEQPGNIARLLAHFNFQNAVAGKNIEPVEGSLKLSSKNDTFVLEHEALRVASGIKVFVDNEGLPDLTETFSFNLWTRAFAKQQDDVLLAKWNNGRGGKKQFCIRLVNGLPYFMYMSNGKKRGVEVIGLARNDTAAFAPSTMPYVLDAKAAKTDWQKWTMLTFVFDRGNIQIYKNSQLVVDRKIDVFEKIDNQPSADLCIGAEPYVNNIRNLREGNCLINDLRIYDAGLKIKEIEAIYAHEKEAYMRAERNGKLEICKIYRQKILPDSDPEYNIVLKRTADYLAKLSKESQLLKVPGGTVSKVWNDNGLMRFAINDREYFPIMAQGCCGGFNVPISSPKDRFERVMADPAAAGLELLGVMPNAWRDYGNLWLDAEKYDFAMLDCAMEKILSAAPNARVQFVIFPEPPAWFMENHNAEMPRYHIQWSSASELRMFYTGPMASSVWRTSCNNLLKNMIEYMERQPYADHIYDYKLFMSGGGEWHWPACFDGGIGGYSQATEKDFRDFLKKRYGSDATLQKAWGRQYLTLATAKVPTPEERSTSERGFFRDPIQGRSSMDFRLYMGDTILDCVKNFTRAMKEAVNYRKTVTIYQGYSFCFFRSMTKIMQQSGFDIYRHVLELDTIDHIGTPISYGERELGNAGPYHNPFNGSTMLHNKMLWQENDLRTHLRATPEYGSTRTAEETREVLRRGFAMALTTGMGFWYFPNYQYHDDMTLETIAELKKVADQTLDKDRRSCAEVALVFDEASSIFIGVPATPSNFIDAHAWYLYCALFKAGVPFDCYLQNDLANEKMPDYKLYIFVNSYYADQNIIAMLRRKLEKNSSFALWAYAPGLLSDNGFCSEQMSQLTGINLKFEEVTLTDKLLITDKEHPITRDAGAMTAYPVGPVIYADDINTQVLGTFDGRPALAIKKNDKFTSVFTLMPFNLPMLKGLCDFAKIHRYCDSNDVFTANQNFVFLHTSSAGDKTIRLPFKADVVEMFSKQPIAKETHSFTDKNLPFGKSRLYFIKPQTTEFQ